MDEGKEYFLRRKISDTEDTVRILYVGRLSSIKGIDLLIRAFDKCRHENKLKLIIVGDGEQRQELETLTEELKLKGLVSFEGFSTDIISYLKTADLFIYPSVCEEVFGISIVEAMAFGIPCIANRVGGVPELIVDGKNGFLTDEISSEGIRKAILRAVKLIESDNIKKISMNARKTAESFVIKRCIDNIEAVLKEVV